MNTIQAKNKTTGEIREWEQKSPGYCYLYVSGELYIGEDEFAIEWEVIDDGTGSSRKTNIHLGGGGSSKEVMDEIKGSSGSSNPVHLPPTGENGYREVIGCNCKKCKVEEKTGGHYFTEGDIKMCCEDTPSSSLENKIQQDLDNGKFGMICSNETTFKEYVFEKLQEYDNMKGSKFRMGYEAGRRDVLEDLKIIKVLKNILEHGTYMGYKQDVEQIIKNINNK